MKCPHCLDSITVEEVSSNLGSDCNWPYIFAVRFNCPACKQMIISLNFQKNQTQELRLVYPKGVARRAFPSEVVPERFLSDYKEAALVLEDSPKASAALSRRCLQHLLREVAKVKRADLSKEIDEVIASNQLPSHIVESLDAVRHLGNFAAHPIKSTSSGEIVEVEPGEAEWSLDVLESLFDFYFVMPAETKKKRDALNKKLTDAGKPPLKIG